MSGYQTSSMVGWPGSIESLLQLHPCSIGSPPVKPSELQTPQIPGDKMSFMAKLRLVWLIIRRLPQFIFNRPSVVDARVELVCA